ncbi:ABC transporter substrate-binding protein, partial [Halopseudomonas sp.]|uniref:ABC transporter substrate-binding protein n=1 Tax=Halopseudomonas sp. TaxID=2901191 RepID=UPI00300267C1
MFAQRWQPGRFLAGLIALWGLTLPALALEDLAGRALTPPAKVERIVLGEGRLLPVLAVLEGDAVLERLVGMPRDLPLVAPGTYAAYIERYPALAEVPPIGQGAADTFSLEQVLALQPDLAVFSLHGHGPGSDNPRLVEQLERAGVTVVFVDFREQPLRNTPRSVELLGELLGRQDRAQAFAADYRQALAAVTGRLPTTDNKPSVFLHSRAGLADSCCETMARGMLATLLAAAGG